MWLRTFRSGSLSSWAVRLLIMSARHSLSTSFHISHSVFVPVRLTISCGCRSVSWTTWMRSPPRLWKAIPACQTTCENGGIHTTDPATRHRVVGYSTPAAPAKPTQKPQTVWAQPQAVNQDPPMLSPCDVAGAVLSITGVYDLRTKHQDSPKAFGTTVGFDEWARVSTDI